MEVFEFCLEIVKREAERFNIGNNLTATDQITAATANDINYDIARNRCAYLYRCGAINVAFAADCFSNFMMKYEGLYSLLSTWKNCSNLTMSSITKGPALDYVAFLLSCQHFALFQNIKILSKYGAWRNTVNIMKQVVSEGFFKPLADVTLGNVEVIQANPLQSFSENAKKPICNSDVLVMIKSVKFETDLNDQVKFSNTLMELFDVLKPGAVLFCIDTKPVTALIIEILLKFSGTFLFGPSLINTMLDYDCPDSYKMVFGCSPVLSARGIFFVWQKSRVPPAKAITKSDKTLKQEKLVLNCNNLPNENNILSHSSKFGSTLIENFSISPQALTSPVPSRYDISTFDSTEKENKLIANTEKNVPNYVSFNQALQNKLKNTYDKTELSTAKVNTTTQILTPSVPFKNEITYDPIVEKSYKTASTTTYTHNNTSCNESSKSQLLNETYAAQITALTNTVKKLTIAMNKSLDKSVCKNAKIIEQNNQYSLPTDSSDDNQCALCFHDHCDIPHVTKSSCLDMVCKKKYIERCCQYHVCHSNCLEHNHIDCGSLHESGYQASRNCSFSQGNSSNFTNSNDPVDGPKLIIPLNNLSGDVLSQIISSLSKERLS